MKMMRMVMEIVCINVLASINVLVSINENGVY